MERLTERLKNGVINVKYASQHETAIHRLVTIEDILGDNYDLNRLRELVELTKNIPHICRFCVGCEMEPKDGHGCDEYDSFVFSTSRLRELVEADRDGRCVVYQKGYPVMSHYYKDEDGLYIREVSGVVSKEEYENSIKIPESLSPEGKKLYYEILTGEALKGEQND